MTTRGLLYLAQSLTQTTSWPTEYRNTETFKVYRPHHEAEAQAVFCDSPRFVLIRGGEGSGKTVDGAIKALERIKRGLPGIVVAPNLPHFRRSTWPEFRRWIPWDQVVPNQRYRQSFSWEPRSQFQLAFQNGATVLCGGIEDPGSWEGPNVNWVWIDEARNIPQPDAFKVLNGRARIMGPQGIPPQLWLTTTTAMHWLFDYFGPVQVDDNGEVIDPYADLKDSRIDVVLRTADNVENLSPDYVAERSMGLSEVEQQVLLEGAWAAIDSPDRFIESILWWDACQEQLPPLGREPMVLALDAGIAHDSFGIVGVTRHYNPTRRKTDLAVRYARAWVPPIGGKLDFGMDDGPEQAIRALCRTFNVIRVRYDPYQLHDLTTRLTKERVAVFVEFNQGADRMEADTALRDLILRRGIAHDGNADLRRHLDNADRKLDTQARKMRLVKRTAALKIDLAVALSMAAHDALTMPLPPGWGAIVA